jgi:hypothetical protein
MDSSSLKPMFLIESYPVGILQRAVGVVTLELIMWGAALFFITIVMVTPCGRDAVEEYARQTIAQFAAQLPFSHVTLAFMALGALGSILLMCGGSPERPDLYWVWRGIRGELDDEASRNRSTAETLVFAHAIARTDNTYRSVFKFSKRWRPTTLLCELSRFRRFTGWLISSITKGVARSKFLSYISAKRLPAK